MDTTADAREPDLSIGIDEAALPAGGKIVGHVAGERVLLVRVGADVFAIGAKCTHYGGPLGEGLVVGDTVRCPWHHACFSLRTGEVLRPPALKDVSRWKVERRNGRIRVTGKEKPQQPERAPRTSPESIVIVGAGAAGNAAAETLRREGYSGPVTMIDAELDSPYDRPNLSKDYLAGKAPEKWLPLHPAAFYERESIEIVRGTANNLDVQARTVVLDDGSSLNWGALILAPGAEPIMPDIAIDPAAKVLVLRSLADSRALADAASAGGCAVIVGAGFIGLEVAASLRQRGLQVHVVAPQQRPLERIMGPDLGDFIKSVHEENGVVFHTERTVRSISGRSVTLDDASTLDADFTVVGIGVRPRVRLAEDAGLSVANGIAVNEYLETSSPNVWAVGDAASWPDPRSGERVRVEHWVLAERMGQTAARNALGARERFDAVPFFWSQHYDDVISYVGLGAGWDEARLDGDPRARDCAVTFLRNGERIALATIFRDIASLEAEVELERR